MATTQQPSTAATPGQSFGPAAPADNGTFGSQISQNDGMMGVGAKSGAARMGKAAFARRREWLKHAYANVPGVDLVAKLAALDHARTSVGGHASELNLPAVSMRGLPVHPQPIGGPEIVPRLSQRQFSAPTVRPSAGPRPSVPNPRPRLQCAHGPTFPF